MMLTIASRSIYASYLFNKCLNPTVLLFKFYIFDFCGFDEIFVGCVLVSS